MKELEEELRSAREERVEASGRREEGGFKEKERKYLEFIREKSSRIEDLLKEVEKMQDSNCRLLHRAEDAERRLAEKDSALAQLEQQKQLIQAEQESIRAEAASARRDRERLASKLAEAEDRFNQTLSSQVLVLEPTRQDKEGTLESKSREDHSSEKRTRPGWRNDFANKVKNACNYYKK